VKRRRRGKPNSMPWKLSVNAFVSGLGSLSEKGENREIDGGLLKCFLLLQTLFPAVCNRRLEKSVADRVDALSEVVQRWGRERKHHQRRRNPSTESEGSPKG